MYNYSHGGNAAYEQKYEKKYGGKYERRREDIIDLSANINPLGMPEHVREAIIRAIPACSRYPDSLSRDLRDRIAAFEHTKPDWVFCGHGASDIIFRLPRALRAKKVLITAPTFSDYARSAQSCGAEIVRHVLSAPTGFTLDSGFIQAVRRDKPDLVFVCNPNNPTGQLTESALIQELLECCRREGAFVAVDECFLDFAEQAADSTSKVFLARHTNLIIIKAFTKLFALPGIRLGYALCANPALMDNLSFHGTDWPVSNLAQAAGMAALENAEAFLRHTVAYVSAERRMMEQGLTRLGYKIFAAQANSVFLKNPYPYDLREELDRKGIRIRSCANYDGLDESYFRIAVAPAQINAQVLAAVAEVTPETAAAAVRKVAQEIAPVVEPEQHAQEVALTVDPERAQEVTPTVDPEHAQEVAPTVDPEHAQEVSPTVDPERVQEVVP